MLCLKQFMLVAIIVNRAENVIEVVTTLVIVKSKNIRNN